MADVLVEQRGAVTVVTLNRPAALNSLTYAMHEDLQAAFDAFAADDAQRVCVITGAGERAFCAGSDLKSAMAPTPRPDGQSYAKNGYAGLIARFDLNKPLIAAVNGVCLGGGFEIALACDMIIAADHATFGLPEPRVGAVAVGGGMHRLQRQIGLKLAMEMALTGRQYTAAEGFRMGYVNQVVPLAGLQDAVDAMCADIARCAPLSLAATKEVMMRSLDEPSLAEALAVQASYPAFRRFVASEDRHEGGRAFREKRAPRWQGR